jgi:hypothetical protein
MPEDRFARLIGQLDRDAVETLHDLGPFQAEVSRDRLEEGGPKQFWYSATSSGVQFSAGSNHIVGTIFVYVAGRDGFSAYRGEVSARTRRQVRRVFGTPTRSGVARTMSGRVVVWDRFDGAKVSVHFEYAGILRRVRLITFMAAECAPN